MWQYPRQKQEAIGAPEFEGAKGQFNDEEGSFKFLFHGKLLYEIVNMPTKNSCAFPISISTTSQLFVASPHRHKHRTMAPVEQQGDSKTDLATTVKAFT
jgi:hypothetical protein